MLDAKSYLMNVERNPVISTLLKKTFYAQFCAGERKDEVVQNANFARSVLGYDGILFEYALEVLGGATPTAEETREEIEVWRKGMLQSVDMAKEGDFVGLKYVLYIWLRYLNNANSLIDGLVSAAMHFTFSKTSRMQHRRCGQP